MRILKKRIRSVVMVVAGWVALTPLFCPTVQGYSDNLIPLYQPYYHQTIPQLIEDYNKVVAFHYKLRVRLANQLTGEELQTFFLTDNTWIEQRDKDYNLAVFNRNCPALIHVIVLQNLRNGKILEKYP